MIIIRRIKNEVSIILKIINSERKYSLYKEYVKVIKVCDVVNTPI